MSDDNPKKPLTLQLKRSVETSSVQQQTTRGRAKTITVEVKKSRNAGIDSPRARVVEKNIVTASTKEKPTDNLTQEEREARLNAIKKADSVREKPKFDPVIQQEKPKPKPKTKPNEEAAADVADPMFDDPSSAEALDKHLKKKKVSLDKKKENTKPAAGYDRRQKGKLTITNALNDEERIRSLASVQRARQKAKRREDDDLDSQDPKGREVILPEVITPQELANRMAVRAGDVVKELMKLGIMNAAAPIDADTAELIIQEFGHTAKRVTEADVETILEEEVIDADNLHSRPPVVTIMGHVDHGKTSLLDVIRKTDVTAGEAGGITQHIGAYQVTTKSKQKITFLDTPGHAAFTAMRKRGANVTDIVILVVAADDGIMPQTKEAISHAKAAGVPIIVAINKVDKPDADPGRVKNELLSEELVAEDMGGDIQVVEVSAKTKQGIDELLDAILLQAEMLDLKASESIRARGTVVEARLDKNRGVVATVLIQQGVLKQSDNAIAGYGFGRIKAILDDQGKTLKEAGPSTPVEILGLSATPQAGDSFNVVPEEKQARDIIDYREKRDRELKSAMSVKEGVTIESLFKQAEGGNKELNLIVKGDVQGSVEAIIGSIQKLEAQDIAVKFVHMGAGGISESDVQLAATTGAMILAFNVRADARVRDLAAQEGADIRYYSIIYNLIDDIKAIMGGLLDPVRREEFIGTADILEVFNITKVGNIGGCKVSEGLVKRGAGVRLIRDNVVVHEGTLKTLKRFKDEVQEVKSGYECGMAFENYNDIKVGDRIEAYEVIMEQAVVTETK